MRYKIPMFHPIPTDNMKYYYGRTIAENFESLLNRTVEALKSEGFGILTEIDVKETLKKKIK